MKRFYSLIFIITCFLVPGRTFSQVTFQATVAKDEHLWQLQRASNDDLLLSFRKTDFHNIVIKRITKNGKEKWSKSYTGFEGSYTDIEATKDNGFLAHDRYKVGRTFSAHIIKCDSLGNVVWSKILDTAATAPYNEIESKICEAPDGNIYFVSLDIHQYFQIVKLNKDGNLLWCKRFPSNTENWDHLPSITSGSDSGLIITLEKVSCEGYCSYSYIQKFDKKGNTQWGGSVYNREAFSNQPINVSYQNNKISVLFRVELEIDSDSKYCFWAFDAGKGGSKATLIDYDIFSLKNFLSTQKIKPAKDIVLNNNLYDMWLLMNDRSLLHVYTDYSNNISFTKYDTLNRVCPDYTSPQFIKSSHPTDITMDEHTDTNIPQKVALTNFIITTAPYTIPFLVTCSGKAPSIPSVNHYNNASSTKGEISLYPNPATNNLVISGLPISRQTSLQILNSNGVLIKEIKVTGTVFKWNVSSLQSGAYFIKISDGSILVIKPFIKK